MLTVEQILTQLNTDDISFLPREALEQAILQQDAITPALLTIIENATKAPHSVNDTPAFIYALCLLAQFREKRAYPLIVKYFGEIGLEYQALAILGYVVTEDLCYILASVCHGDIGLLKDLIENQNVNEYVRVAALDSLVIIYNIGQLSREELIAYLKVLINRCLEQTENPFIVTSLVWSCCDIHPEELYDLLVACFDQELVDEELVEKDYLEFHMEGNKEEVLADLKKDANYHLINDAISEMESWAYFNPLINGEFEHDCNPNKVGRNDLCPCGSGRKYKKCCLH